MRKFILPWLLCFFTLSSFSQKQLPEPGKVTMEELQLPHCSFDTDAPAMKLFEEEETNFEFYRNGDMQLKTEHRTRIKLFNEKVTNSRISVSLISLKKV